VLQALRDRDQHAHLVVAVGASVLGLQAAAVVRLVVGALLCPGIGCRAFVEALLGVGASRAAVVAGRRPWSRPHPSRAAADGLGHRVGVFEPLPGRAKNPVDVPRHQKILTFFGLTLPPWLVPPNGAPPPPPNAP
jgi:hypothetical protein